MTNTSTQTQTRTRRKQQRLSSLPWACNACLQGRLSRTKPDEKGKRKLMFACTDGTLFEVAGVGSDAAHGGGATVIHLLTYADQAFNQDGYWLVYPTDHYGKLALTLAHRSDNARENMNTLQFAASVKAITDDTLTLFVGRRNRPGFHFLTLTIPSGLVLPEGLGFQSWVTGTATRQGNSWELATIEAKAKPSEGNKP